MAMSSNSGASQLYDNPLVGLRQPWVGSGGVLSNEAFYPIRGTSPTVVEELDTTPNMMACSVVEQLNDMRAALSLTKSQLAHILNISRPTLYEWLKDNEPSEHNAARLHRLMEVLGWAHISGAFPLNARFVRTPMAVGKPSLLEQLSGDLQNDQPIRSTIEEARRLSTERGHSDHTRTRHLQALGFEEVSQEQRKTQLENTVALQDWPK